MEKELSEMTLEELWALFPIYLEEYKPYWKDWYKEEEAQLSKLLTMEQIERISHIGSTSIPDIWAKPIIDIMIETSKKSDWTELTRQIESAGYLIMYEEGARMCFNKGYTKAGFSERVFHLHVRRAGDNDELYFKEYLLEHPTVAKEYEYMKLDLWKKYEHKRDAYTDSKTEFIRKYTEEAKELYQKNIRFEEATADSKAGQFLMEELSDLLENITGSTGKDSFQVADVTGCRGKFILAKDQTGSYMGCGAIRPFDRETAELKRLYVRKKVRVLGESF